MASNRRFILLIFGVKLADIRATISSAHISEKKDDASAAHDAAITCHGLRNDNVNSPKKIDPASNINSSLIDFANYNELPRTFTNQNEFPQSTNLLCWHCCLTFTHIPRFIAVESIRTTSAGIDKWIIDGNFCSWSCAAAYIEQYYEEPKKWILLQNLAVVRAQFDNTKIAPVKPAPSRVKMRLYCGRNGMSQQEYSELVESLSLI